MGVADLEGVVEVVVVVLSLLAGLVLGWAGCLAADRSWRALAGRRGDDVWSVESICARVEQERLQAVRRSGGGARSLSVARPPRSVAA
ncbi:hypothetical protein [Nocardia vermiculata]|uniref:Uncharacterized protein n=1 Tax=Nocardia vermiculata TaxID=257274 RepID=A0A846XXD9_9NOCA|nr:hypothetical protein [Nocardia vermiculata]NKY50364.1 hypothetical protein [Nocardia vermiculata]